MKLDDHTAAVRLKLPPDEKLLRQTVQQAGYVVMGILLEKYIIFLLMR